MGTARSLTIEQVQRLRTAPHGAVSQLCRDMGVNRVTAQKAIEHKTYRDVPAVVAPTMKNMVRQHAGSIFKLAAKPDLYQLLMSSRSYMRHL